MECAGEQGRVCHGVHAALAAVAPTLPAHAQPPPAARCTSHRSSRRPCRSRLPSCGHATPAWRPRDTGEAATTQTRDLLSLPRPMRCSARSPLEPHTSGSCVTPQTSTWPSVHWYRRYWGDAASPLVTTDLATNSYYVTRRVPIDRLLAAFVLVNCLSKYPALNLILQASGWRPHGCAGTQRASQRVWAGGWGREKHGPPRLDAAPHPTLSHPRACAGHAGICPAALSRRRRRLPPAKAARGACAAPGPVCGLLPGRPDGLRRPGVGAQPVGR